MFGLLFAAILCFFLLYSPSPSYAAPINATIDDQDVAKIDYQPLTEWDHRPLQGWESHFWNGSRTFTWTPGATATFRFTGTGIWVQGPFAPDQAQRRITLNGVDQGVFNALAPERTESHPFWSRDDLPYTTHTLVITHADTRDRILALDAFIVQFDEGREPFPYSTTTVTSYAPTVTVITDGSGHAIPTTLGIPSQGQGGGVPDPINDSLTSSNKSYTAIILGIVIPILALIFCCVITFCVCRRRRTNHRQRRRESFRKKMFARFGGSNEQDSTASSRMYVTALTSAGGGTRAGRDDRSIAAFTIASTHYSTAEDHFLPSPRTPRSLSPTSPVPFSTALGLYDGTSYTRQTDNLDLTTNARGDTQARINDTVAQIRDNDDLETGDGRRRDFDIRHTTLVSQSGAPPRQTVSSDLVHAVANSRASALANQARTSDVVNYSRPRPLTRTFEAPAEWESMPNMVVAAGDGHVTPVAKSPNASSGPSGIWKWANSAIGNGLNGNRSRTTSMNKEGTTHSNGSTGNRLSAWDSEIEKGGATIDRSNPRSNDVNVIPTEVGHTPRRPSTVFSDTDSGFSQLPEDARPSSYYQARRQQSLGTQQRQGRANEVNAGSGNNNKNSNRNSQSTGSGSGHGRSTSALRRFSQIITSPFARSRASGGQSYNYDDSNQASINMQGLGEGMGRAESDNRQVFDRSDESGPTYFRGMNQFNALGIPLNYRPSASAASPSSGSGTASPARSLTLNARERTGVAKSSNNMDWNRAVGADNTSGLEDLAFSSYTKQTRDQVISSATLGKAESSDEEEDEKEKIVEYLDGSTVDGGDARSWSVGHDTLASRGTANSPTLESSGTEGLTMQLNRRPSAAARSDEDDYERHANPPPSYTLFIPPDTKMPPQPPPPPPPPPL
ncbi:hypothetical protein FRC17_009331 [Serendipita sp. 399]|nr:hypothetical protein FRC17_009331 [Serendipita sp. 399]